MRMKQLHLPLYAAAQRAAWRTRGRLLLGALALAVLLAPRAGGAGTAELVTRIKATYLYKFASYVKWPAQAPTLVIGIFGADDIADELKRLAATNPVDQQPLHVRVLRTGEPLDGVQILFIGTGSRARALIDSLADKPVLTVTDAADIAAVGSMLNFVLVGNRVRFELSNAQARASGLKFSSRLIGVAQKVDGKEQ
jgi:hypothetical protein